MRNHIYPALSVLFLGLVIQVQSTHAQAATNPNSADRIRTQIERIGTGEKAKVSVQKSDGSKVKGYISRTDGEAFDLTKKKTQQTTSIAYTDVSKIKKRGMSTGMKIAIIGAVATAVVVVVVAVAVDNALDDACFLGCPQ